MKKFWLVIKNDSEIKPAVKLTFFLLAILFLTSLIFFWRLPPQIPLFYSRPWGDKQLSSPVFLFWLTGISLLVLIINSMVAIFVFNKEKLLSKMLFWINTLFIFLIDVAVLKVVLMII
jgi:hypothetical protein